MVRKCDCLMCKKKKGLRASGEYSKRYDQIVQAIQETQGFYEVFV